MPFINANRRAVMLAASIVVLSGCATQPSPVSVADTIAATPDLSTLSSLVVKTGLTDTLKGTGPFTVFAPTNAPLTVLALPFFTSAAMTLPAMTW